MLNNYCDLEDQIILDNFQPKKRGSVALCAIRLEENGFIRSIYSIKRRWRRISGNKPYERNFITPRKVALIHRYAGRLRTSEIADKTCMSIDCVKKFAQSEGISLDWHYEYFTMNELARILGTNISWVRYRVYEGVIESLNHRGYKQHYQITREQVRSFLRRYPTELDDIIAKGGKPDMLMIIDILSGIMKPDFKKGINHIGHYKQ